MSEPTRVSPMPGYARAVVGRGIAPVGSIAFFGTASLLFFLSGATGLAYQVIWFKRFSHVWGNSSLAIAAVVTSFLLGLGLGAHFIGRRADRLRVAFLWYGVFEIAIGALALLVPWEIDRLMEWTGRLYPLLKDYDLVHALVRAGLAFLVLGPACVLMGGTLPLLIRQFTPSGSRVSISTGWLYGVNTVGAAFGCLLAGFYLLPMLGLRWTNFLTVATNVVIGTCAILLALALKPRDVSSDDTPDEADLDRANAELEPRDGMRVGIGFVYLAAGLAGFGSLALEIVWARQLSLILGGSTYAFTAMLFVVLVGIGLGSVVYHLWIKPFALNPYTIVSVILILCVATWAGKSLIPEVTSVVALVSAMRSSYTFNALTCVLASAVLEFVPTLAMGILFPLFVELTRKSARDVGRAVGNVYASNTLGTTSGSLATSLVLIPWLGTLGSMALALAAYLVVFLLVFRRRSLRGSLASTITFAIGGAMIFLANRPEDPRVANSGMYLYGYTPPEKLAEKVLLFEEGSSCNVLVTEQGGQRALRVNGKVDATTHADMATQLGSAYFPLFVRPEAKDVLVIGFGSGTSCGASLQFPDTRVTCCEIEPAVYASSKFFSAVNHRPETSPRFEIVFDDGRTFLQGTPDKYDIILSEPSNPWVAGMSNLFSREFYEAAEERLNKGGLLGQWVQLYAFTPADYRTVVRTVADVFPYTGLVQISSADTILLASHSSTACSQAAIEAAQAVVNSSPTIQRDLQLYFGWTDVRALMLRHYILSNDGLQRLVGAQSAQTMNTDLNLRLEFDTPLRLFKRKELESSVRNSIVAASDADWVVRSFQRWGCSGAQADALHHIAERMLQADKTGPAYSLVEFGLQHAPDHAPLLADRLILRPTLDSGRFNEDVSRLTALAPQEASRVGSSYWERKQFRRAVAVYEQIVEQNPESASAWTNLAVNYAELRQVEKADRAFQKAISLDPLNGFTISSRDKFRKMLSGMADRRR